MTFLAAVLFAATAGAGATDRDVWNEGVDFYRAGDVTNAMRVLKPLMLSPTHGPRAAEVVAKLASDADDLETAAAAAQIALRAAPDDAKANRNFTRAVDKLPARREEARIKRILEGGKNRDASALLLSSAHDARKLLLDAGTYRTNSAPRAVALADQLSQRAEKLEESWIITKEAVCNSVTNEEQAATIVAQVDAAAAKTRKAAEQLGDLDPEGYASVSDVEHELTRFAKQTAAPPAALGEDLTAQTNAFIDAEQVNGRDWQKDALDWTRAFRARFPAWARNYEQQAQADTNKPPFKAEDQAKIAALATELEKVQLSCAEKVLPPEQEKALKLIQAIQELMPKDNNNSNSQNQDQQNQDQQQDQQNQNQNDKKDDPQQNQDQQNQDQQPQTQDQDPNEQQPDQDEGEVQDEDKPEDREVEDVLKKAQERSDEHEADKKARMRKAPLPPNERDW